VCKNDFHIFVTIDLDLVFDLKFSLPVSLLPCSWSRYNHIGSYCGFVFSRPESTAVHGNRQRRTDGVSSSLRHAPTQYKEGGRLYNNVTRKLCYRKDDRAMRAI